MMSATTFCHKAFTFMNEGLLKIVEQARGGRQVIESS